MGLREKSELGIPVRMGFLTGSASLEAVSAGTFTEASAYNKEE
jgi:hypothetical protein